MPASTIRADRRGIGLVLSFVLWVAAISFLYAMVQGQSARGSASRVLRAVQVRAAVFARQSALDEAVATLRAAAPGECAPLDAIRDGSQEGVAHFALSAADLHAGTALAASLQLEPVLYRLVRRPGPGASWVIELSVKVRVSPVGLSAPAFSRTVRRRCLATLGTYLGGLGPGSGAVELTALALEAGPQVEVVE